MTMSARSAPADRNDSPGIVDVAIVDRLDRIRRYERVRV